MWRRRCWVSTSEPASSPSMTCSVHCLVDCEPCAQTSAQPASQRALGTTSPRQMRYHPKTAVEKTAWSVTGGLASLSDSDSTSTDCFVHGQSVTASSPHIFSAWLPSVVARASQESHRVFPGLYRRAAWASNLVGPFLVTKPLSFVPRRVMSTNCETTAKSLGTRHLTAAYNLSCHQSFTYQSC